MNQSVCKHLSKTMREVVEISLVHGDEIVDLEEDESTWFSTVAASAKQLWLSYGGGAMWAKSEPHRGSSCCAQWTDDTHSVSRLSATLFLHLKYAHSIEGVPFYQSLPVACIAVIHEAAFPGPLFAVWTASPAEDSSTTKQKSTD